ncbi:hypothetical protein GW17_00020932 [Ensete ventricosum]|nr:hypothetical protein GW17_00020932 [Ensete ventricosum]
MGTEGYEDEYCRRCPSQEHVSDDKRPDLHHTSCGRHVISSAASITHVGSCFGRSHAATGRERWPADAPRLGATELRTPGRGCHLVLSYRLFSSFLKVQAETEVTGTAGERGVMVLFVTFALRRSMRRERRGGGRVAFRSMTIVVCLLGEGSSRFCCHNKSISGPILLPLPVHSSSTSAVAF